MRRDTLTIFDADRTEILRFDAAPRNPLLGKWNVDSYGVPPSTVVAVLPDTEIDVVFGIGTVGGFAGCNSFSGTYGTNGTVVRISRLATTRLACDEAVMEQETAFLEALPGSCPGRVPRLHAEPDRSQGRDRRRARKAPAARARRERQSRTKRHARGDGDAGANRQTHPDAEPNGQAHPHADPRAKLDPQAEPDRRADGRADAYARADGSTDRGTDGGPAHDRPADGLVQAGSSGGTGRRHDRLPGHLVHGDGTRRDGLPLLRRRPDHGAGRPGDARHAGPGGRGRDAVPGGRDGGDRRRSTGRWPPRRRPTCAEWR